MPVRLDEVICNHTAAASRLRLAWQVLLELEFDWQYMMRGLVIDKKRGNILKVDRHKYVKIAYHGFSQLPRQERLNTYAHSQVNSSGELSIKDVAI